MSSLYYFSNYYSINDPCNSINSPDKFNKISSDLYVNDTKILSCKAYFKNINDTNIENYFNIIVQPKIKPKPEPKPEPEPKHEPKPEPETVESKEVEGGLIYNINELRKGNLPSRTLIRMINKKKDKDKYHSKPLKKNILPHLNYIQKESYNNRKLEIIVHKIHIQERNNKRNNNKN